jgi:hypothetical protein
MPLDLEEAQEAAIRSWSIEDDLISVENDSLVQAMLKM